MNQKTFEGIEGMIGKQSDKYTSKQVAQITNIGSSINFSISSNFPTTLFQQSFIFADARKSGCSAALHKILPPDTILPKDPQYILGGALLHRISWQTGLSYQEIVNQYVSYVNRKYLTTKQPYIVFVGYSSAPTKDCAYSSRTGGSCEPIVSMERNLIHNIKKDIFPNEL